MHFFQILFRISRLHQTLPQFRNITSENIKGKLFFCLGAHLNWTFIIMRNIHKQCMSNSWHQRPQTWLNKRSDRLTSKPINQPPLFMAIVSSHGLQRTKYLSVCITITTTEDSTHKDVNVAFRSCYFGVFNHKYNQTHVYIFSSVETQPWNTSFTIMY